MIPEKLNVRFWAAAFALFISTLLQAVCVHAAGAPLRLVVIVAPGGSADAMARMVGDKLSQILDTVVIVENKPGGGGNLATQIVAKALADGNTLLVTANNHTLNPTLFADAGYHIDDLVPIADLMWGPSVVVVPANSKYQSFSDLLSDARAHPNALSYGSAGIGSPSHIAGELLNQVANIKLLHVPYRGSGPSLADLIGGQIPIALSSLVAATPIIKAGKLRALAVTSSRRWPGALEIPTVAEYGIPSYEHLTFIGMMAPKGTSASVANKLSAAVMRALDEESVKAKVISLGGEVGHMDAKAFKQYIDKDFAISSQLVKETGMKPE